MMLLMQGGTLVLDRQQLRVEDVQMIGIAKHDPPVVYASGVFKFQHGDEGQVFLRTSDHRPVNAEEQRILDDLQAGHEIVSQAVAGGITSVAAIRAMPNCLQCHQSKREGDTMGAFVYRLRVIQE
ncbi:MAG: hypothetical protein ABI858_08595 [Pseudoxanthomonas sp.]